MAKSYRASIEREPLMSRAFIRAGLLVWGVAGDICSNHCFTDRKSTRLNSSHLVISYAVFCLKKKNKKIQFAEDNIASPQFQNAKPQYLTAELLIALRYTSPRRRWLLFIRLRPPPMLDAVQM